ncbi:MAG: hypothetical protein NDI94_06360 [Candidatus Woesearchaeota archaeon]|nr:hypothetical protein [Candidatus Woesearchaeota archaeon]
MKDAFYTSFKRIRKDNPLVRKIDAKLIGLIFIVSTILIFFMFKMIALYLVFIGITAMIIYYTKLYHIPIDISPLFFLEVVITRYYGFSYTLAYVLVAYIIPKTLAGTNMKFDSYMFIAVSMVACLFAYAFPTMPLIYLGLLTSIIQYIGGVIFSMTMRPFFLSILDGIANVTNNLLWFLIFSDLITWILG